MLNQLFEIISSYFEHLLVIGFFLSLICYLWYRFYFKKQQIGGKLAATVEYIGSFLLVMFLVLGLRSFVAEPFRIPSGSMIPSLLVKDFLIVSKYSYGIKLPITNQTLINVSQPKRGDVVVFRYPLDESQKYIKRLIGLPGDHIIYKNNQMIINGDVVTLSEPESGSYIDVYNRIHSVLKYTANMQGFEHVMQTDENMPSIDIDIVVPKGQYFMMGDNRDNSNDSRAWGAVPEKNLIGKAQFIWLHWGLDNLGRIGSKIH